MPPNKAQLASDIDSNYARTLRHLLTNVPYVLLLLSYGVNVGVFYAISTLLNQVISKYLPVSSIRFNRIRQLIRYFYRLSLSGESNLLEFH